MLENVLTGIEKPGRYTGGEVNARRKHFERAAVRFALAFPDVYEVGMSHIGLQILYQFLNDQDDVMADRVYAPWFDYENRLRELQEPLRGLESEKPLREFDFVGFSLQYELSYTNVLTMLDLGRIPFESRERGPEDPWVIAGGPCAFNPEPLADFFDFIVIGEAEEVLPEVIEFFRKWKASGGTRREFLEAVRTIEGVYVPSFFEVSYGEDGTIEAVRPQFPDYARVRKRLVLDLDRVSPIPEHPLVPSIDIVHNRLSLEIARGCTRGCRFCQASFIYRPVREREPTAVFEKAVEALKNTGFEDVSLLSLSTGDYCSIQGLLAAMMERFAENKVAVSLPSMRVGTLTTEMMELIREVRKTGFTLAPEAGSERLRRVINKQILDEDLFVAVDNAYRLGWRVLKLYFMTGLPTEGEEDLESLADLCKRIWELGKKSRASVNVSVSAFVPKPQTPFQWFAQVPREHIEGRLNFMKDRLKRPGMRFKWHHPDHSVLEAVFARGDRRLGAVLKRAWELGARFDGWTEHYRQEVWDRAFADTGLYPEFYANRERSREEVLPWDHLSARVERDYLWKEYERALAGEFTSDCRWNRCTNCGVCDHQEVAPQLHRDATVRAASLESAAVAAADTPGYTYWFRYSKIGNIRHIGQLEVAQIFSRAIRRAGLPAAYTKGFHPHVKLSFDEALPLGMESMAEEARLTLTERVDPDDLKLKLNEKLPEGLRIEQAARMAKPLSKLPHRRVSYQVSGLGDLTVRCLINGWKQRVDEPLTKKTKKGELRTTLGEVILGLRAGNGRGILNMDLYEGPQFCFRPALILEHLLGESAAELSGVRIMKMAVFHLPRGEEGENACRTHSQC